MQENDKKDDKGLKCTVGETLSGIAAIIDAVLMATELKGGYGAYKLSYAEGNSGFSFGPNQIDLSERTKDETRKFINILENAKDEKGNPILNSSQIKIICGDENSNLSKKGKTPEAHFGKNLDLINAALSSDYGTPFHK